MTAPVRIGPPRLDAPASLPAREPVPVVAPSLVTITRTDGAGRIPVRAIAVVGLLALVVVVLAVIDVTQGTAAVGLREVGEALLGRATPGDASVVIASRLPRMAAGILVGVALGAAGAALQTVSRNVLASPDTLAVNAGAYAALAVAAVTGITLPVFAGAGIAFGGGLAAAAVVLAVSGLGSGTVRLVLAGSALALGLASVTSALLLLFPRETSGLYQWGQGSIGQNGFEAVAQMVPVVIGALVLLLLLTRRLDALGLGDDAARSLGVDVRATRVIAVLASVLLSAAAVTVAGPIGFVGLYAPAFVRPLRRLVPGVRRSWVFIPVAGLMGAAAVLLADVLLRAILGAERSVQVPTGLVTTVVGAIVLVILAVRARGTGALAPAERHGVVSGRRVALIMGTLVAVLVGLVIAAVLLGDAKLLLGDVLNGIRGTAGPIVSYVLETRVPRVVVALLAGAALALAGVLVQAVTRNPLADPAILGVSGGAGLGAVMFVTAVPLASGWGIAGAAGLGALAAAAVVFGLAARGGFPQNRLVLIGVGVSAGTAAAISLTIVLTDPFNGAKALTWLSGSTYGRDLGNALPVLVALVLAVLVAASRHRMLDLVSLDDDTPRLLGVGLARSRLLALVLAVVLTATAVAAVGVIGFVGLVAPHAARALVGSRHSRVLPVAILLGASLVTLADLLGRTVIAPAQLGAGLVTALVGTPYFVWLLWRGRGVRGS